MYGFASGTSVARVFTATDGPEYQITRMRNTVRRGYSVPKFTLVSSAPCAQTVAARSLRSNLTFCVHKQQRRGRLDFDWWGKESDVLIRRGS